MSDLSDAYEVMWDGQLACFDAETIEINGEDYPCEGGLMTEAESLEVGGYVDEPGVSVSVKRSLFTSWTPQLHDEAIYQEKAWKIQRIRSSPDNTVLHLDLELGDRRLTDTGIESEQGRFIRESEGGIIEADE